MSLYIDDQEKAMDFDGTEKETDANNDILDMIYWQAKFAALRLDVAVETRQSDGAIASVLPAVINGCADVLKEYPYLEEVRAWQKKALLLQRRINPYALPVGFESGFEQWNDDAYEAGWCFYHLAKMSVSSEYWGWARSFAVDAISHFTLLKDRLDGWPVDVREWIPAAQKEMENIREEASRKIKEHFQECQEFSEIASRGN